MKLLVTLLVAGSPLLCLAQTVQKSSPSNQDLTSEQTSMVFKLANVQKNFGKKMNTPGVDLSLKEIDRSKTSDRTLVKYFLFAKGLPTDLTYTLYQVQINGRIVKFLDGVTIDPDGMARCTPRKAPVELVFFAGKAEPKRLSLVSNDGNFKAFISTIPFPNSVTDKACSLESVIGTPKGEITYVQGIGFEPNEELTIDSESYGEKVHAVTKAEADGSYFGVTMPHILGKSSGTTRWSVKGKNCSPVLNFGHLSVGVGSLPKLLKSGDYTL